MPSHRIRAYRENNDFPGEQSKGERIEAQSNGVGALRRGKCDAPPSAAGNSDKGRTKWPESPYVSKPLHSLPGTARYTEQEVLIETEVHPHRPAHAGPRLAPALRPAPRRQGDPVGGLEPLAPFQSNRCRRHPRRTGRDPDPPDPGQGRRGARLSQPPLGPGPLPHGAPAAGRGHGRPENPRAGAVRPLLRPLSARQLRAAEPAPAGRGARRLARAHRAGNPLPGQGASTWQAAGYPPPADERGVPCPRAGE